MQRVHQKVGTSADPTKLTPSKRSDAQALRDSKDVQPNVQVLQGHVVLLFQIPNSTVSTSRVLGRA